MRSTIIIACLCIIFQFTAIKLEAQLVSFQHDMSGNRISRTLESGGGLKSLVVSDSTFEEKDILKDIIENERTTLFPNPTQGLIWIDFNPEDDSDYYVALSNSSGFILLNQKISKGKTELDISSYPAGMYLIIIFSEKKRSHWKILKI